MSEQFVIKRAERTQARLRIGLQGSSGGGKTATSLILARGMVAALRARNLLPSHLDVHVGLIDTERDSAKLYSHLVAFDTIVLEPPYTVERYLGALSALERVGYPIIIIDQISHEWNGEGGILAQVAASRATNDFAKWNGPSQDHDRFVDRLLSTSAHLICTMRAKTEWALEEKEVHGKIKKVPVRIGMQAKQREGMEYEFSVVLDLAAGTNQASCIKDRTELFTVGQSYGRLGSEWGTKFIDWVYSASAAEPAGDAPPSPAERAQAMYQAFVRAVDRAPNMPDLESAFVAGTKGLREFAREAGADVIKPLLEQLIAAKDARKATFGTVGGVAPLPESEPISPDDVLNLEMLISDAGILPADVKAKFGIPRLASLDLARFNEVQSWIIDQAGARGIELASFAHVPAPDPVANPKAKALEIVDRIAAERSGGDLLANLKSDVI